MPHLFHAGFSTQAVQQRPNLPSLAEGIVNHEDILSIVAQVGRNQEPDLKTHCKGAHQHDDGHHVLHDDDDFAINRLGLESERAAHNLDRLRFLNQ